jgi:hypothetical protein
VEVPVVKEDPVERDESLTDAESAKEIARVVAGGILWYVFWAYVAPALVFCALFLFWLTGGFR